MTDTVNITVIGVGGGGGNMISHISKNKIFDINLISSNTDLQVLSQIEKEKIIQLGKVLTKGLGAGMNPKIGEDSAIESENEIREALRGSDIVFITAGMGGGTGTGAAPIIAKIAKEIGALSIAVVTTPFKFEGKKRMKLAIEGINNLKTHVDSLITIKNEKLLEIAESNLGLKEAFILVDSVLSRAVNGISSVIMGNENSNINLDFADFKTIMTHQGDSIITLGKGKGDQSSEDAIEDALYSPLLGDIDICEAKGALIHFEINKDFPLVQLGMSMNTLEEKISEDADIIFGTTINDSLEIDEVKVTLVISGIEKTEKEKIMVNTEKIVLKRKPYVNEDIFEDNLDIPTFLRESV